MGEFGRPSGQSRRPVDCGRSHTVVQRGRRHGVFDRCEHLRLVGGKGMLRHVGKLALAGNEAAAIVEPSLSGGVQQSGLAGDIERLDAKGLLDPLLMLVQRRTSLGGQTTLPCQRRDTQMPTSTLSECR